MSRRISLLQIIGLIFINCPGIHSGAQNVYFWKMIFVTGGTGFIGSHLLYHLVSSGKPVRALKRKESSIALTQKIFSYYTDTPDELLKKIAWADGDILDYYSLLEAFQDVDQVYHTAAVVSFHAADKSNLVRTNVEGTANVVNAALELNIDKLCFMSSIGALGRAGSAGLVTEDTHFKTSAKNSVYSTTKYEAEKEVWRGVAEGLDAVIVNPSIVVGPGNWSQGSPQVFQTMWKGLKFYTTGVNGFIDVNDVAKAMMLLMDGNATGERFILSTENVPYKQFFEWMAMVMGKPAPKYKAGPLLSSIGSEVLKLKGYLTGKRSTITKETAKTANQVYQYSNKKILNETGMQLIPVKESVENTTKLFLLDHE